MSLFVCLSLFVYLPLFVCVGRVSVMRDEFFHPFHPHSICMNTHFVSRMRAEVGRAVNLGDLACSNIMDTSGYMCPLSSECTECLV